MMSLDDAQQGSSAFVAVGSNIEPERNIPVALTALMKRAPVKKSSTFYRTEPVGPPGQPEFVNGLWLVETHLSPIQFRDVLHVVEAELDRVRVRDKYAPRVIDLDLVLYDNLTIENGPMKLPHPDVARPFVYVPLIELLGGEIPPAAAGFLPSETPVTPPGRVLPELTQELRDLLSRQTG